MKDRKLAEVQDAVHDIENIVDFLEDKEEAIKKLESLDSEAFRLQYITELAKKLVSVKNEFMAGIKEIKEQYDNLASQRQEIIEQLARERILVSDLVDQIVNMKEILAKANISQKTLDKLLVKTKEYLIECTCCKIRVSGTMDEIMSHKPCTKCKGKGNWEIRTRVLA